MSSLNISIIVGSTRPNRFSDKPAKWILDEVSKLPDVKAQLLDLRDYPLPFYDLPMPASMHEGKYENAAAQKWFDALSPSDAFIIVTPEYNHGPSAVLKNALDYVYTPWNKKAVGFVSYGGVGGARSVEQLRMVCIELQMAPVEASVNIPGHVMFPISSGKAQWTQETSDLLKKNADKMLTQLLWWAKALKAARDKK